MSKAFFIDTTRCTACRGCQIACKEWHDLPATKTRQWGSHQNPPDLNGFTYKLVRFSEEKVNNKVFWYFFPEQCRHCIEPPCKMVADMYDEHAILQDEETGAVIFTERTKNIPFEEVRAACPYNIPRQNPASKVIVKCDMCIDRVKNGLLPMCVQTCPTGAMNFGEREEMLALAKERLAEVKRRFPDAVLGDADSVSVIYLFQTNPATYHKFAVASASMPPLMNRKQMLAKIFRPVQQIRT